MTRRNDRELERSRPEMKDVIQHAKGDIAASQVVEDACEEEGLHARGASNEMMQNKFAQVMGEVVWLETPNWVYLGRMGEVGRDFIALEQCCRLMNDGQHGQMMTTGQAPNMQVEITGGPTRKLLLPTDWLGPWCVWPFKLPK